MTKLCSPQRNGHPYQAFYCEENVWQLALRLGNPDSYVLWLANEAGVFAMWQQRAGAGGVAIWDYHVVLACPAANGWLIYDHDSVLPFPAALPDWMARSFLPLPASLALTEPSVRIIRHSDYISRFSSDRSHMRKGDGQWQAPPPSWGEIGFEEQNVFELKNVSQLCTPGVEFLGEVVSLQTVKASLGRKSDA